MEKQQNRVRSGEQSTSIRLQLDGGRLGLQGGPTLVRNVPSHVRECPQSSTPQEGDTGARDPAGTLLGVSCQGGSTSSANIYLGEVRCCSNRACTRHIATPQFWARFMKLLFCAQCTRGAVPGRGFDFAPLWPWLYALRQAKG